MMDCRHPLTRYDQQMLDWSSQTDINIHILLTKADKERNNALNSYIESCESIHHENSKTVKNSNSTIILFKNKTWFDAT